MPQQIIDNSTRKVARETRARHKIEEFEHVTYFADIYIVSLNYREEIITLAQQHNGEEHMKSVQVKNLSELCFKLLKIKEEIEEVTVIKEMKSHHIRTQIENL